jgi:flagellar biosynthesis/type III secretory pathway ATPase
MALSGCKCTASVSRCMKDVVDDRHLQAALKFRNSLQLILMLKI